MVDKKLEDESVWLDAKTPKPEALRAWRPPARKGRVANWALGTKWVRDFGMNKLPR